MEAACHTRPLKAPGLQRKVCCFNSLVAQKAGLRSCHVSTRHPLGAPEHPFHHVCEAQMVSLEFP